MSKIKAEIDKPDNWDEMTLKEKKEYFAENMEILGSLCHQCTDSIETEIREKLIEKIKEKENQRIDRLAKKINLEENFLFRIFIERIHWLAA